MTQFLSVYHAYFFAETVHSQKKQHSKNATFKGASNVTRLFPPPVFEERAWDEATTIDASNNGDITPQDAT